MTLHLQTGAYTTELDPQPLSSILYEKGCPWHKMLPETKSWESPADRLRHCQYISAVLRFTKTAQKNDQSLQCPPTNVT